MKLILHNRFIEKNFVYWVILLLIICLPFPGGGMSLCGKVLMYVILLIGVFVTIFTNKKVFLNKFHFLFGFWLLAQLLSLISLYNLSVSLIIFFQYLEYFLLIVIFSNHVKDDSLKHISHLILAVAFVLSCWRFLILLSIVTSSSNMNLVDTFYGHSHLAGYLPFALPFSLNYFLYSKKLGQRFFHATMLTFFCISMLFTFSRAVILVWLIYLFVVFIINKVKRLPIAIVFIILIFLVGLIMLRMDKKGVDLEISRPLAVNTRLEYWNKALDVFFKKPLVGSGIGTYEIATRNLSVNPGVRSEYAHNFLLHALAETGVLGFLALSFLIIWIFYFGISALRISPDNPQVAGCFGALLSSFLYSLVDFDWHFPAIFLTFLMLFLSLLGNKEKAVEIR